MDTEFYTPNQLHISYQNGMDGKRGSFTIPRWLPLAGIAVLVFLLVSSVMFYIGLAQGNRTAESLQQIKTENQALKTKLDFYAATVDSIYRMMESSSPSSTQEETDYPSLDLGSKDKSAFPRNPGLTHRTEELETHLAFILSTLSTESDATLSTLNELPAGDQPSETTPSIYPTFGRISDGWGLRIHPIRNEIEFHQGIDIANQMGTPIYATAAGTVTTTDYDTGYGKRIIIRHAGGYETLYAHMYSYQVRVGDSVTKGQIIGLMGSTGISTGPHLHYEVRTTDGKVNPSGYLNRIDDALVAST